MNKAVAAGSDGGGESVTPSPLTPSAAFDRVTGITDDPTHPCTGVVSIVFAMEDRVGALKEVLALFQLHEWNIKSIRSREVNEEAVFDVDLDISSVADGDDHIDKILTTLRGHHYVVYAGRLGARTPWYPRHISDMDLFASRVMSFGEELDADHPGFTDEVYRARRKSIVEAAKLFRFGDRLPLIKYTDAELATWAIVFSSVAFRVPTHCCRQYRAVWDAMGRELGFGPTCIPQLYDVSNFLQRRTGFTLRPVMGLLSSRDFLNGLAFRVFHSTQYIRHASRPDYTPEPDICHEIMGHVPLLADPAFAEFSQTMGLLSIGASDDDIKKLATVYWFTVEFGVCREVSTAGGDDDDNGDNAGDADAAPASATSTGAHMLNDVRVYGAGIISSPEELQYSLMTGGEGTPEHLEFDLARMSVTEYPIVEKQPRYFVAPSFEQAKSMVVEWARTALSRPFDAVYDPVTRSVHLLRCAKDVAPRMMQYAAKMQSLSHSMSTLSG